jgi:hypothetical protein
VADIRTELDCVRGQEVEFVSFRPPGATTAALERRIEVTGPPAVVALLQDPEPQLLQQLTDLLGDERRAWAAHVLLASLTGHDAKNVELYGGMPGRWWHDFGASAQLRWQMWLDQQPSKLSWDSRERLFVPK